MSVIVSEDTKGRQVLPKSARPTHYVLTLTPDLEKFTFEGQVTISLEILETTSQIVLNSNELDITHASIKCSYAKEELYQEATEIAYDTNITTATLHSLKKSLLDTRESYLYHSLGFSMILCMAFIEAHILTRMEISITMATTQFEPNDARKAFPCWDEPATKATFDIVLKVPTGLVALSNMNVIDECPLDGTQLKEVKFATTFVMSTYLLAFIVGDLDFIESHTSVLPIKVNSLFLFVPEHLIFLKKYLEYHTLSPRWIWLLSQILIQALWRIGDCTMKTKQDIASTVAHELAHQWFGDLVTLEWWSHLWLNEGFATWAGHYAVDKLFPEWDFWTEFVISGVERGLELDAKRSSHPIEVEVKDPNDVNQLFDDISYFKGASVICMLCAYLSEVVFLKGVHRYLKKHMYSNASTDDLWEALSEESGQDVSKFMTLWTKQAGYPYLEIFEENVGDNLALHIEQKRYLSSDDTTADDDQVIWWVPLGLVSTEQGFKPKASILTEKKGLFLVPKSGAYKLNFQVVGFFRVHYPISAIQKLGSLISSKELLTPRDRIKIISDTASLAQRGMSSSVNFLELLCYFGEEDNYLVMSEASTRLCDLLSVWYEEPEATRSSIKSLLKNLFNKVVRKLGWEFQLGESKLDGLMRDLAIGNVGLCGDYEVLEEARRRFNLFLGGDPTALHPDLRSTVYHIVLNLGGDSEYQALKKIYCETESPDQKLSVLSVLGYVTQPALINDALNFAISDEVCPQGSNYLMSSLSYNPHSRRTSWAFVKSHWDLFEKKYSSDLDALENLIQGIASNLTTEVDALDVEKFFSDKDLSKLKFPLTQALESIRSNASWLARDRTRIESWLASNKFIKS
ncbi:hypothetical protein DSO57_1009263 [Entomophthora muscae]|uniref:Uncharacterized protein n=1 Tax=Entomophthora muscae TaxID=34485 RepID=A0ACC2UHT3_9FUNG|nr:hypothetical protein DSO57_1009263 [Entomophthora muscae]